jgi:hypothetical protein
MVLESKRELRCSHFFCWSRSIGCLHPRTGVASLLCLFICVYRCFLLLSLSLFGRDGEGGRREGDIYINEQGERTKSKERQKRRTKRTLVSPALTCWLRLCVCIFSFVPYLFKKESKKQTYTHIHTYTHPLPSLSAFFLFLACVLCFCCHGLCCLPSLFSTHRQAPMRRHPHIYTYTEGYNPKMDVSSRILLLPLTKPSLCCRGRKHRKEGRTMKKEGAGIIRKTRRLVVSC